MEAPENSSQSSLRSVGPFIAELNLRHLRDSLCTVGLEFRFYDKDLSPEQKASALSSLKETKREVYLQPERGIYTSHEIPGLNVIKEEVTLCPQEWEKFVVAPCQWLERFCSALDRTYTKASLELVTST